MSQKSLRGFCLAARSEPADFVGNHACDACAGLFAFLQLVGTEQQDHAVVHQVRIGLKVSPCLQDICGQVALFGAAFVPVELIAAFAGVEREEQRAPFALRKVLALPQHVEGAERFQVDIVLGCQRAGFRRHCFQHVRKGFPYAFDALAFLRLSGRAEDFGQVFVVQQGRVEEQRCRVVDADQRFAVQAGAVDVSCLRGRAVFLRDRVADLVSFDQALAAERATADFLAGVAAFFQQLAFDKLTDLDVDAVVDVPEVFGLDNPAQPAEHRDAFGVVALHERGVQVVDVLAQRGAPVERLRKQLVERLRVCGEFSVCHALNDFPAAY
jgi:hypothetical protein